MNLLSFFFDRFSSGPLLFRRSIKSPFVPGQNTIYPDRPGLYVVTRGTKILYVGMASRSIRNRHLGKFEAEAGTSDYRLVRNCSDRSTRIHCYPTTITWKRWIQYQEAKYISALKPSLNLKSESQALHPLLALLDGILNGMAGGLIVVAIGCIIMGIQFAL